MSKQQMIADLISTAPDNKLDIILSFVEFVLRDTPGIENTFLSEPSLAEEWLLAEEDTAWKDL